MKNAGISAGVFIFAAYKTSHHDQVYLDVAAGGIRIRANLVSCFHQLLSGVFLHTRQRDLQLDLDAKALRNLANADRAFDLCVRRYR